MNTPPHPFRRLRDALDPTEEQRSRMLKMVRERMTTAKDLRTVKALIEPDAAARIRVWNRIQSRIAPARATGLLGQVRAYLTPDTGEGIRIGRVVRPALQPVVVPARPLKWVAAFAIVVVALRASPLLFLAPQTIAQSSVLLHPTRGDVSIALGGLFQPIDRDMELEQPTTIDTDDGEATIILHDDGTIRLAPDTSVTLQDLTDRPEKGSGLATLTVASGTVWMQGMVPDYVRGLSLVTPKGIVTVHGGSVSVTMKDDDVSIEVWDRHARLERENQADIVLVAGERLTIEGETLAIARMPASAYDKPWPSQNLQRDAVHQREVAQMQRERIAARAGILPTSRLYPVKRIAETVDVLLTFDHETAVKKKLDQATTRLNEAATLIAAGQTGADLPLQEYKITVLAIANGSGDTLTQQLVEERVAENAAQLSAQLPGDDVYAVKMVVLDTTSQLPTSPIDAADVEASVLGDAVDALEIATAEGNADAVQDGLEALVPYIQNLPDDGDLDPTTKKEVLSRLTRVADTLQQRATVNESGSGAVALRVVSRVVRSHVPTAAPVAHLTEEEIASMVDTMLDRVFTYTLYTGQTNQLTQEIRRLEGHPDQGMILRALYRRLETYEMVNSLGAEAPDYRLSLLVRSAIQELREKQGEE